MTINVIRANVDDWTTFFVGLEVSTYIKNFCCLSFVIKASLNFSLWRQIPFYSLISKFFVQHFFVSFANPGISKVVEPYA